LRKRGKLERGEGKKNESERGSSREFMEKRKRGERQESVSE